MFLFPFLGFLCGLLFALPVAAQPDEPRAEPAAEALPEVEGASVELSWAEVRALLEQLTRYQLEGVGAGQRPPLDAMVHSARLRVTVGEGVLLVDGTVDAEVLVDGWTTVPLFPLPTALRGVSIAGAGEPARLVATPDGGVGLLLHAAGPHPIELSYAVAVDPKMGPKTVAVPLPHAGSIEVTFVADARLENVTAEGAVLVRSTGLRVGPGDADVVTQRIFAVRDPDGFVLDFVARRPLSGMSPSLTGTPGGPEGPTAVEPAAPAEPPRPVRYRADTGIDVAIDPAAVRAVVRIELSIHDAPLEAFDLDPLPGWELVKASLDGTDEPLRLEPADGVLTVRLPYPVEERAGLTLLLEQTNERKLAVVAAPAINVHGAYRQEGAIGFRLDSTIEGAAGRVEGGGPADPGELTLPGGVVAQVAFRFHKVPYAIEMALRYHEPRAVLTAAVERALVRVIVLRDGKTAVDAAYLVRNSRHAYLAVTLPPGAEPWGAFLGGRAVQLGQRADRPQVVLVALPRPEDAAGEPEPFVVQVTYFLRGDPVEDFSGWDFALPRIDLPIAVLDVEAYLPAEVTYRSVGGRLDWVAAIEAAPLAGWSAGDYRGTEVAGKARDKSGELENALWDQTVALTKGALAARFELPKEGTLLRWHGAIVLPDEPVGVEVTTRPAWLDRLVWWGSAGFLLGAGGLLALGLAAWAASRRRRGWLLLGVAAASAGAVVAARALAIPVARPYLVFLGFVVAGVAVGAMNLFRALAAMRRGPAAP
ncbi:MAG: hypothetical protein HY907_13220 [Deltaproteobacteria bacterium]|nr:hypothetical protein [Deltaproteobacteria bacterium]